MKKKFLIIMLLINVLYVMNALAICNINAKEVVMDYKGGVKR